MRGRWTRTGEAVTCPCASVKTRFKPANLPAGLVAVVPSNPMSCGPVHCIGRFVSRKLPAESATAEWPVHPVLFPLPSNPSVVTVTPASGVSRESETTVRPSSVVVGATNATEAAADWVCRIPLTVAAAEIEIVELVTGWLRGVVSVRIEVCPTVIDDGLNDAVMPDGRPLMPRAAS